MGCFGNIAYLSLKEPGHNALTEKAWIETVETNRGS